MASAIEYLCHDLWANFGMSVKLSSPALHCVAPLTFPSLSLLHHLQKWLTDVKPKSPSFEQQKDQENMCFVARETLAIPTTFLLPFLKPDSQNMTSLHHSPFAG